MNKIIIAFCEGQHDIAFLSRILLVNNFEAYNKKIKDYIPPLNELFKKALSMTTIADKKLGFQSEHMVPSVAYVKEDEALVLLHNLSGDNCSGKRTQILSMYQTITKETDDDFSEDFDLSFKFLYFLDADQKGIKERENEINNEVNLHDKIEHGTVKTIQNYEWGCYIYHDDQHHMSYGTLEDILLQLMQPDNEQIFKDAENYINNNRLNEERQKEFVCTNTSQCYKERIKFQEKKSIISIAGQLQFSSMSNAVIIAKSDYIKHTDINNNSHCQQIKSLFL